MRRSPVTRISDQAHAFREVAIEASPHLSDEHTSLQSRASHEMSRGLLDSPQWIYALPAG